MKNEFKIFLQIMTFAVLLYVATKKDFFCSLDFSNPDLVKKEQPSSSQINPTLINIFQGEEPGTYKAVGPTDVILANFEPGDLFKEKKMTAKDFLMLQEKKNAAFIIKYKDAAITTMEKHGIPASIKLAQALIESRAGESRLAVNNNNLFGMKCFSKKCKKGHCTNLSDDHHKDFFRKYKTVQESWNAHSSLISQGRYKKLSEYGIDYKKWATGLKKAGYATDKNYDKKLINTIEKYKLYQFDS